jgi:hypothetical protein
MPFKCKQAFPRKEKCLLDHLSPFWDFRQSVLQSFSGRLRSLAGDPSSEFLPEQTLC